MLAIVVHGNLGGIDPEKLYRATLRSGKQMRSFCV